MQGEEEVLRKERTYPKLGFYTLRNSFQSYIDVHTSQSVYTSIKKRPQTTIVRNSVKFNISLYCYLIE